MVTLYAASSIEFLLAIVRANLEMLLLPRPQNVAGLQMLKQRHSKNRDLTAFTALRPQARPRNVMCHASQPVPTSCTLLAERRRAGLTGRQTH